MRLLEKDLSAVDPSVSNMNGQADWQKTGWAWRNLILQSDQCVASSMPADLGQMKKVPGTFLEVARGEDFAGGGAIARAADPARGLEKAQFVAQRPIQRHDAGRRLV